MTLTPITVYSERYNYHDPKTHRVLSGPTLLEDASSHIIFKHLALASSIRDTEDSRLALKLLAKLHVVEINFVLK